MKSSKTDPWQGLDAAARTLLKMRDYKPGSFAQRLSDSGIEVGELAHVDRSKPDVRETWIPGVEIFSRNIYSQRHRGIFGEFARRDEGALAKIQLWPAQWATARMFAGTAKGFHVHPPSVPDGKKAASWFQKLFVEEPNNYSLRRYDREQWDIIFFVQGVAEMILRDVRAGLPPRTMRFFVDGDNHRSTNNAAIVIPPGVAHAIRVEGSEDVIMVYGTSTSFRPEFEGRIASEVESAILPEPWQNFLSG
jgi:dTDP-4-dehydrorhamnose 3,5-epimerase-like enzyme